MFYIFAKKNNMKRISLFLFFAISIIYFSCNDNDDDNNDNGIYGVWNVTDVNTLDCNSNGQSFTYTYTYQISIDKLGEDSIIITNLNERNFTFKGIFTGSSLSFSNGSSGSGACSGTGIFSNNTINFTIGCHNANLYGDYGADCPNFYYITSVDKQTSANR